MGFFKDIYDFFADWGKESVNKDEEQKLINELAGMEASERKRLEGIVKEYAESYRPADKTFEYVEEYIPIDKETLYNESEKKYTTIYNEEKDKTNSNYNDKISTIEEKEKGYIDNAESKSDSLKEKYKDKQDNFKSKASKNGIADSSIKTAKAEDLDNERDSYIDEVMVALKNKLNVTNEKKEELLQEKNNKISALDDNFKANVEKLFNDLLAKEEKKVSDVEKANKAIAAEEKAYKEYQEKVVKEKAKEMEEMHKKMKEDEASGNFTEERKDDYGKRLKLATDFYSKYAKGSAIDSIQNNDVLKNLLGSKFYKLVEVIKNA